MTKNELNQEKEVQEVEKEGREEMFVEPDPIEESKKQKMDSLIEKGKKGKLSVSDLDEAMEEMNFDADTLDKLYEELEDNGISFGGELSNEEMSEIESEVENSARARTWSASWSRRVLPLTTPYAFTSRRSVRFRF